MLIHRLHSIDGMRVKVDSLSGDPHGEVVGIWANGQLRIVQVLSILRYFQIYRKEFQRTHSYTFPMTLPSIASIAPIMPQHQILYILLSQRQEDYQYIVFINLNSVEAVKYHLPTSTVKNRQFLKIPYQVLHATLVGLNIYIAMYNLSLAIVDLTNMELHCEQTKKSRISDGESISTPDTKETLHRKQIMRFCEKDGDIGKVWQSAGGFLMANNTILSTEFHQKLDISNSYEEYQYRQNKVFCPIKYQLTSCRNYLIGSDSIKSVNTQNNQLFIIRSKITNWSQIAQLNYKPQINPYFTVSYHLQKEAKTNCNKKKLKEGEQLNIDRLLIATYNPCLKQINISWIVVDLKIRKKLLFFESKDPKQSQKVKYQSQICQVLTVKNIKHCIQMIKWIGLNQLVYQQEEGQLYFMEFNTKYLIY